NIDAGIDRRLDKCKIELGLACCGEAPWYERDVVRRRRNPQRHQMAWCRDGHVALQPHFVEPFVEFVAFFACTDDRYVLIGVTALHGRKRTLARMARANRKRILVIVERRPGET